MGPSEEKSGYRWGISRTARTAMKQSTWRISMKVTIQYMSISYECIRLRIRADAMSIAASAYVRRR